MHSLLLLQHHFYQHINTVISRKLLLQKLQKQTSVCFDTETTGLKALEVELIGISFSWETGKGYYVSFPDEQIETKAILEEFRSFFENKSIENKSLEVEEKAPSKDEDLSEEKNINSQEDSKEDLESIESIPFISDPPKKKSTKRGLS